MSIYKPNNMTPTVIKQKQCSYKKIVKNTLDVGSVFVLLTVHDRLSKCWGKRRKEETLQMHLYKSRML